MYAFVSLMRMNNRLREHPTAADAISHDRLKLENYYDRMTTSFGEIFRRDPTCAAAKFHHVMNRFQIPRRDSQPANVHPEQPNNLHLLSSVATGSNPNGLPHAQQPAMSTDGASAMQVPSYAFPVYNPAAMQGYNLSAGYSTYTQANDPVANIMRFGFDIDQTDPALVEQFFFQDAGYGRIHDPALTRDFSHAHAMGGAPPHHMGPMNGAYHNFQQQ